MQSRKVILEDRIEWVDEAGDLHRVDGPAVEWTDGTMDLEWWLNGKRHRLDGPAIIEDDAYHWYQNGEAHRIDGPSYHDAYGNNHWYTNGIQHCTEEDWFDHLTEEDQINYIFKNKDEYLFDSAINNGKI